MMIMVKIIMKKYWIIMRKNEEILDNNEEEDVNLNIEELRKDVLENNDDLD